jgi:hypothetical protein
MVGFAVTNICSHESMKIIDKLSDYQQVKEDALDLTNSVLISCRQIYGRHCLWLLMLPEEGRQSLRGLPSKQAG